MKIPVVVVDDSKVDRYSVRRRLSRNDDFGEVFEAEDGEIFLEQFYSGTHGPLNLTQLESPLMVLMDINMPRLNGFETVEKMQERMEAGVGPQSIAVLMFTSSSNEADVARAESLPLVRGYFTKPLSDDDVIALRGFYLAELGEGPNSA